MSTRSFIAIKTEKDRSDVLSFRVHCDGYPTYMKESVLDRLSFIETLNLAEICKGFYVSSLSLESHGLVNISAYKHNLGQTEVYPRRLETLFEAFKDSDCEYLYLVDESKIEVYLGGCNREKKLIKKGSEEWT